MTTHFDFTTDRGIPMRVVLLQAGEENPNYPSVTSPAPTVEFYDRRYQHTPDGQFTGGRYNLSTLTRDGKRLASGGIDLYTPVAAWKMNGPTYQAAMVGVLSKAFAAACLQET